MNVIYIYAIRTKKESSSVLKSLSYLNVSGETTELQNMRQKLSELKGEINKSTTMDEDFNTLFSVIELIENWRAI